VATIVVNELECIEFKNLGAAKPEKAPTLSAQMGEWSNDGHNESGVMFDVYGTEMPFLTPTDIRKLARWLVRAADELEGVSKKNNRQKPRRWQEDSEQDDNTY
jgi:hypothetical protein